jgi:hypothetical protein
MKDRPPQHRRRHQGFALLTIQLSATRRAQAASTWQGASYKSVGEIHCLEDLRAVESFRSHNNGHNTEG